MRRDATFLLVAALAATTLCSASGALPRERTASETAETAAVLTAEAAGATEPARPPAAEKDAGLWERRGCPEAKGGGGGGGGTTSSPPPPPPGRRDSRSQLRALRHRMQQHLADIGLPVDAYIVPYSDEHQGEPAARDRRRTYLSGFSGSRGVAVVTATRAALWTDGRYLLQADAQLGCQWELCEYSYPMATWLAKELSSGGKVGADPRLISQGEWQTLSDSFKAVNLELVEVTKNLVDKIWAGRPNYKSYQAYVHNETFSGLNWLEKIKLIRKDLQAENADAMVVTSLDEVAWLLNVRGYDLPHTPVLRAYVILSLKDIFMYVNESQLNRDVEVNLRVKGCHNEACVRIKPYEDILKDIKILSQKWTKVLLPTACAYDLGVSHAVYESVHPAEKRYLKISPILIRKAHKNSIEVHGMRAAHIRDAVAFCDFMGYYEWKVGEGHTWSELEVAREIDRFRGEQQRNRGPSFSTIAGYGPNGALPHYEPTNETSLDIGRTSTFVLDSGGQYLDGTTDVTRTLHFGTPTEFQKEVYTRVLIGSIQLASLKFPPHVKMSSIDVLARGPLWSAGLDYHHGTGHGIGSFLSVHESPISIHYGSGNFTFDKGYFFSDEPGYYEEGQFGVRLENILEVVDYPTKFNPGEVFYGFEPVTLIPYEPVLMNLALLNQEQRDWLNDYNGIIRQKVGMELKKQNKMRGFHWMMNKTGFIPRRSSSVKLYFFNYLLLLLLIPYI